MRPPAQVQAAIEALDEIIVAARDGGPAADTVLQRFFQKRRYAGSGDRRAIREYVYRAIRRSGERPASGRAAMLGVGQDDPEVLKLFDWSLRAPVPPIEGEPVAEAAPLPEWLLDRLDPLVTEEEIPALLERAPLDLRVNRLKADRESVRSSLADAEVTPHSIWGLRLSEGTVIEPLSKDGLAEVQDEGSQLVAIACRAEPGMRVIDLCAGAGGKTLALAAEMENQGQILAGDVDRGRLSRLGPRAERAGASIIETRLLDPRREGRQLADWRGAADVVLVDAPCSGSGTWRRNPETRWRLDPKRLDRIVNLQSQLLDLAAELVRPGGHLVYAVCSILGQEGREQAEALVQRRSSLVPADLCMGAGRPSGPGRLLTPGHDGTDGFFVARWQAPC